MHPAYEQIQALALKDYSHLVQNVTLIQTRRSHGSAKLRLYFLEGSFMDVFLTSSGKYCFHWERRKITGMIYRFDNAPHHPHIGLQHLHDGLEEQVVSYPLSFDPVEAFKQVLEYIQRILRSSPTS